MKMELFPVSNKIVMNSKEYENSRRKFLRKTAAAGVLCAFGVNSLLTSCGKNTKRDYNYPPMLSQAPDGPVLKLSLIHI